MFIDTHCHISKEDYDNPKEIIESAFNNRVEKLIISGCDKKSIEESINIANNNQNVYLSLGYHPSEANEITEKDLNELKKLLVDNKAVAVGEIGLDYHWDKENKEKQKDLFIKQLRIAKELNLPVIIHSRDAFQDTYDILKSEKSWGTIHCFSGNNENAKMYTDLGFYLGIGGVLTFKNTNLKEVIKEIPIDRILLETDSPYLAPTPYRGLKNEPKYIPIIFEEICNLLKIKKEKMEQIIEENTKRVYKI